MSNSFRQILVIGATGSIGRLVVDEAIAHGHAVKALVRDSNRAGLPSDVSVVVGDVTLPDTLVDAVKDIDSVIFTLGSDGLGKIGSEMIDYRGVRNVLFALAGRAVRIALMTSIGVTNRDGSYNRTTEAHDWKRRSERLVRRSGLPYTIVRPGWFDYNAADQHQLHFLQGDHRQTGSPEDGVIARRQIARVLVGSLTSDSATRKTFELVAERGATQLDLEPLFAELAADIPYSLDAIKDTRNMPLELEPTRVIEDLDAMHRFYN